MSQQQPHLYSSLTAALSPEEQQVVKSALENADKVASERAVAGTPGAGVQQQTNGS